VSRWIEHDGRKTLRVRFPFDRDLVDLIKTLPGRRWNGTEKYWSVPDDLTVRLVDLLHSEGFRCDDRTRKLYADLGGTLPLLGSEQPGLFDAPGEEAETDGNPSDYTVSRLNREAAAALRAAFPGPVWVVGEISGYNKNAHRKHVGFHMVEREEDGRSVAEVNAILFDGVRRHIEERLAEAGDPFRLEDEITVRMLVHAELYESWGQYRVRVVDLDIEYTLGEAARRREEIIRKLTEEGLVERNTSLPFPPVPLRVGLITSLQSDAYNDVLRTLQESGYAFRVTVHGARVQGRSTEPSVLNALDRFRAMANDLDVVLICRGGGSRTDLAWFDNENLGRAVACFPLPVVIGIGHEQDRSVLDAVGWRAKTPTAAAGMVLERVGEYLERIDLAGSEILREAATAIREERSAMTDSLARLVRASNHILEKEASALRLRRERTVWSTRTLLDAAFGELLRLAGAIPRSATSRIARREAELEGISLALGPRSLRTLALESERLDARGRRLHLVDPRRVVERGYSILRLEGGTILTDAGDSPAGTPVRAELRRGRLRLRSEGREPGEG
jgi:exodeoxyribonuclease VII large subunit